MSEKCSMATCERAPHALCHGCKSNFCREHMFEHSLSTHLQLNPLIDQVNQLQDQIKGLNQTTVLQKSMQQLEEWRQKAHQTVDLYFTEKAQELGVYVAGKVKKHDQDLHEVQARITTSMREQDTTHELIHLLTYQIQKLQRDMNQIVTGDFHLQLYPLTIDRKLILFDQSFNILNLLSAYKMLDRSEQSYSSIATDNQFLLLHHENTLLLVDEQLSVYKRAPWTNGPIYDMCYSSALKQFIIINEHEVFLLNKETMSINKVRSIPYQQWFSCTCSDTSLFLSTKVYSSSLVQFNLLRSMAFIKRWASPDLCTRDEAIDGIFYNNDQMAIMISNDAKKFVRIELREASTMNRIWSLPLDTIYNERQAYRFCLINQDEWLIADHNSSRLLHVSSDGKIKSIAPYQPAPCCLLRLGHNTLAVSTKSVVQLHKF